MQTTIEINIIDPANPNKDFWHGTNLLYDVSLANGRVYFRIPESIRQPLKNPQSWTYLSFRIKNKFTSEYAYRLYERCCAEKFRGATDWYELKDFRAMMNVADAYPQFQDLNKRVIKPAVEQINTHSDIFVTEQYQTRGRAKTHVRFVVEENPNVNKSMDEIEKMPTEIFDALKAEFGFSNSQIDEVAHFPLDYLAEKIEFTRYRIKNSKTPVQRPHLYLLKALKEDLRFNTGELEKLEKEQKIIATETVNLIEANKINAAKMAVAQIRSEIWTSFIDLDEEARKQIIEQFKDSEDYKAIKTLVPAKKFSIENGLVKAALTNYLEKRDIT